MLLSRVSPFEFFTSCNANVKNHQYKGFIGKHFAAARTKHDQPQKEDLQQIHKIFAFILDCPVTQNRHELHSYF